MEDGHVSEQRAHASPRAQMAPLRPVGRLVSMAVTVVPSHRHSCWSLIWTGDGVQWACVS